MKPGFAIQTYQGNFFDPKTNELNMISIKDIAHALSNLCRYAGHCNKFYSVAEHSVLTYKIARELWPKDLKTQWHALLHDATEAYVGDVPTPLKVQLPHFTEIEDKLANQIAEKFKIDQSKKVLERVKEVDILALATEAHLLFDDVSHWDTIRNKQTFDHLLSRVKNGIFQPLRPELARDTFLVHFNYMWYLVNDK